jgi:hypothetical protein
MDERSKREALRAYFVPPPKPGKAIGLLALGAIGVVVGLSASDAEICTGIGIVMALAGGVWLLALYGTKGNVPSDNEVDNWFEEDIARITEQSLSKVGLDESQLIREPLAITGPILWSTNGVPQEDLLWKKGKEDVVRFAVNRVTVIHLSDQLLAAYACDFNFLKNVSLNERTDEYHYKDVVSVSTQEDSTSYTLPTGVSLVHSQAFRLSVASGEAIKVTIGAAKLAEITGGTIPATSAEKAVQVIRAMLREKK